MILLGEVPELVSTEITSVTESKLILYTPETPVFVSVNISLFAVILSLTVYFIPKELSEVLALPIFVSYLI